MIRSSRVAAFFWPRIEGLAASRRAGAQKIDSLQSGSKLPHSKARDRGGRQLLVDAAGSSTTKVAPQLPSDST